MIANCPARAFDVIEITNEMPINRLGGVGSVIDGLIQGFHALRLNVLWFVLDHHYSTTESAQLLATYPNLAIGAPADLQRLHAPVAHLHTYNHDPRLLDCLRGKQVVLTVHSLLQCEAESNGVDLGAAVARQEAMIRGCDHVVLVSEAEQRHYRRLGYTALNDRVSVIHNGLACRTVASAERPPRRRLGFCGRLVPRKRPEYVQMILKESGFEDYTSLIAGRGFSPYSRQLLEDPELRRRVRYLGWCGGARLEAFYHAIDVLAIPSVYEPFGMVALEAMARGVPVLCTRTDGLVEILADAAVYADDGGYTSFRDAMWRWRDMDAHACRAMATAARARYERLFTATSMAGRYRALFDALASPGPHAGAGRPTARRRPNTAHPRTTRQESR